MKIEEKKLLNDYFKLKVNLYTTSIEQGQIGLYNLKGNGKRDTYHLRGLLRS